MTFEIGNKLGKGRPKKPEIEELRNAIKLVQKQPGRQPLLVHFVEQAYENKEVLVVLLRKLIPDMQRVNNTLTDADGNAVGMTVIMNVTKKYADDTVRQSIEHYVQYFEILWQIWRGNLESQDGEGRGVW
jgi:hypothetical protein